MGHRFSLLLVSVVAASGCNAITGAEGWEIGSEQGSDGPAETNGNTGGSAGSGGETTTGPGSTAGPGSGSGAGDTTPEPVFVNADGVSITDIDLYQGVRRRVVEDGQPAQSDIPIVAGKTAMVRVFYETDAGYNDQPVTARITIGGAMPIEVVESISGSSQNANLGSTINIDVPGDRFTVGADFRVELLQEDTLSSGSNSMAAYPSTGTAPLEVEQGGRTLKILLVPVNNNGSLPDTSTEQVAKYHRDFSEQYPVAAVDVQVRSQAFNFNGYLGNYNGWSNLLDDITDLRDTDNAPADVYYYGIHDADGNGLLGLGWVSSSDQVWGRAAIGVGWTGDTAPGTAVHELGHNHGRNHSPCGVSGDSSYPHSGARIGVWGYRPHTKQLLDPDEYVDFMSYCDPAWVSDWTFKALFARAAHVSSSPSYHTPPHLLNRTYERIKVLDGVATFKDVKTLTHPPQGEQKALDVVTLEGPQTISGHYYPYNHIDGGVLYVMRPATYTGLHWISAIDFAAEGHTFRLVR